MNNEAMKEILNDLFSHLERLETQSEAILQFLKEKKRVTEKQLAPYLEQAANASNVKWRAARVRIDHLLEPEHPEKEIKLGKKPELNEESLREGSSEEKRSDSAAKEDKRIEAFEESKRSASGDQKQIESSDSKGQRAKLDDQIKAAPAEAAQARPANGKEDKPETKSEVERKNSKQAAHDQRAQKSDSGHHPTEVSSELASQEGAEPAAQLKSDKTDSGKEAA
jgi:hypothetical protein